MSVAEQAKQVYDSQLKAECEAQHRDRFIAIEPISKSYYLGDEFVDAALAAKRAYPERESFVIRIGHEAAFHLGASRPEQAVLRAGMNSETTTEKPKP